jgi:acyl carrier protein
MALTIEQAHQKIIKIYQSIDTQSKCFGSLVNWQEGISWHYGIALSNDLIFDTAGFNIFEKKRDSFFIVPGVQKYTPQETVDRLCYFVMCFRDWDYGVFGWNCEHAARLIASNQPVSYEVKKAIFPIPQLNHDGWHPEAQAIFATFIDENPYLLTNIFTLPIKTKASIEKIQTFSSVHSTPGTSNLYQDDQDKVAIFSDIQKIVVEQLEVEREQVNWNSHLSHDLGADELDLIEIIMILEEEFDLEIPDNLLMVPNFLNSSGFSSSGGFIALGSSNSFYNNSVVACTIGDLASFVYNHRHNGK